MIDLGQAHPIGDVEPDHERERAPDAAVAEQRRTERLDLDDRGTGARLGLTPATSCSEGAGRDAHRNDQRCSYSNGPMDRPITHGHSSAERKTIIFSICMSWTVWWMPPTPCPD